MTLVVPVYNEAEAVAHLGEEILRPEILGRFRVILVDDGSTDGGAAALEDLCRGRDDVRLLRHDRNLGYGAAIKTGILEADTEFVAIIDSDGSYPAECLPGLAALCEDEGCDMVVGARDHGGLWTPPLARRPARWLLGALAAFLTRTRIPDLNSGMRVFRAGIALDYLGLICDGFSFTTTLTLVMLVNRCRVRYVPIEYRPRRGRSKIRPLRDTGNFLRIILTTVLYFRPLRVLLPPALTLLAAGGLWGAARAASRGPVPPAAVLMIVAGFLASLFALLAEMIVATRPPVRPSHRRPGGRGR